MIRKSDTRPNRRQALALGRNITGGLLAAGSFGQRILKAQSADNAAGALGHNDESLFKEIEEVIQAQGMYSDGVFSIEIDRNDINNVTLNGVPIKPAFQINGTLYFQRLNGESVT